MSILFGLAVASSGPMSTANTIPLQEWVPMQNDHFIADTETNQGYIVHPDGSFATFPIGSGKEERVNYAHLTYNAATPDRLWTVKSTTIQTDHGTFGKTGLFLRLSSSGDPESHYGIHATGNINDILKKDDRYKSMGCILVSDDVLDILAQTYALNSNTLSVATIHGLPAVTLKSALANSL
jgi:hypothetical protein